MIFSSIEPGKSVSVHSNVIFIILWNNSFHFVLPVDFACGSCMKSLICYKFADGTNVYALQIEIYYGMSSRRYFVFFFFSLLFDDERCSSHFLWFYFSAFTFFSRLIHNSHWILICFKRQKDLSGLLLLYFSSFFSFHSPIGEKDEPKIIQWTNRYEKKKIIFI